MSIKAIHTLKSKLKMSEGDYRAMLMRVAGAASSRELTDAQDKAVVQELRALEERRTSRTGLTSLTSRTGLTSLTSRTGLTSLTSRTGLTSLTSRTGLTSLTSRTGRMGAGGRPKTDQERKIWAIWLGDDDRPGLSRYLPENKRNAAYLAGFVGRFGPVGQVGQIFRFDGLSVKQAKDCVEGLKERLAQEKAKIEAEAPF